MTRNAFRSLIALLIPALLCLLAAIPAALAARAVEINLFYSQGCRDCDVVKGGILADLTKDYAGLVQINGYDISDLQNYLRLIDLEERHGIKEGAPVTIFIGDRCLSGKAAIERDLYAVVEALLDSPSAPIFAPDSTEYQQSLSEKDSIPAQPADRRRIIDRFKSFRTGAVLAAGLADGINPCAFATIAFLISFLTFAGRTRRDILLVSASFGLAVFITYTLLGLGAFKLLAAAEPYRLLSKGVYYAAGVVLLMLAVLSLRDAVLSLRKGGTKDMALKLPDGMRDRIHSVIRNRLKTRGLLISAFTTGFLVSLLESACTGQVYLPTIVFITKEPALRMRAYYYLILYNLMFIVPLAVVAGAAYLGVGEAAIRRFGMRNVFLAKLLLAAVFFGLAAVMLSG